MINVADRGRPKKLNKNIQEEITLMLKMGNYLETAAAYAGIDVGTIRRWMKRGKRELERVDAGKGRKIQQREEPYVDFCMVVEKAIAEGEVRHVQIIYNVAKSDAKYSTWFLEHRFPDRWGKKEKYEVTGKDGGPIKVEDPRETLLKKLDDLAKRKAEADDD